MNKVYLETEEVRKLEEAAGYLRDRLLVRLLFHLGCRVTEALNISVDDIDFNHGTVTIRHLKARLKLLCPHCSARLGRRHNFCPECGLEVKQKMAQEKEQRRLRTLPIDRETLNMIKDYVKNDGPVSSSGKRLLFGINRHRAWQIIRDMALKAGLPRLKNPETGKIHYVSPHRLRDAFAIMAVKKDDSTDSVRMLQEHLGHQNITTTMKYRKVSGDELKDWYHNLWREESHGS